MTTSTEVNTNCHYATATELAHLHTLGALLPDQSVVMMLGAGPGVMLMSVLEGNPRLLGYIVDHDTCQWAEAHLASAGFQARTRVYDSAQAGLEWTGPRLGLLIVDADHGYEGVRRDCAAWLVHVAPGGYVFFHDYNPDGTEFSDQERYPGVAQAVGEVMQADEWTNPVRAGTAIIFQRAR